MSKAKYDPTFGRKLWSIFQPDSLNVPTELFFSGLEAFRTGRAESTAIRLLSILNHPEVDFASFCDMIDELTVD